MGIETTAVNSVTANKAGIARTTILRLDLDAEHKARFFVDRVFAPFKIGAILMDENNQLTSYYRIIEGKQLQQYQLSKESLEPVES